MEKNKLKRQEKLANEGNDAKRQRLNEGQTDIPSVRIDFGKDGVHLIQPESGQFPAKYSDGTAEWRTLPIVLYWDYSKCL